ncbi:MAG: hypothetical protein HBSIN02_18880 [Bacteroidia bacterium]|nr:MAG: hypothetical protein HBSIN02_18880 [Bacteroidia bacterium]
MRMLVSACFILFATVANAQLSGTLTVGSGGTYADLSSAFSAINSSGVSGTLVLSILGDFTEPGTTALTRNDLTATNNVVIKPAASTSPVITVSGTDGIDINGAGYVTIDGSNSGGTSRDLTIKRSAQASGSSVIYLHGSGTTITVKNCILGDATNTPDYALRIEGPSNVVIQNNEIHGIGNADGIIYFSSVNGSSNLISQNTISGDQNGSSKAYGINLAAGGGSMTISKNKFHVLKTSGGPVISGIRERMGSGTLRIQNNFVGGGFVSSSSSDYYLLDLGGGGAKTVYHNTLLLNAITGSPFDAAALYVFDGTCDFRNNIVINTYDVAVSSCINNSLLTAQDLATNYNNLYAPGSSNSVGFDGQFQKFATLSNWQGWTGVNPDPNSVSVSVSFSNSSNDFHLTGGSNGDTQLRGTDALIATVTDDIDGDTRLSNPNGPYMGADEGSINLPVQMSSFTARASGMTAHLIWRTESELENYGFEIERREMSVSPSAPRTLQWMTVGFVQGSGTSSSPREYSFIDETDRPGRYAYRIKQIDHSGAFTYTSALEVFIGLAPLEFSLGQNYPNPFNPTTSLRFSVAVSGPATLRVYDVLGRQVAELFNTTAEAGRLYQVDFNAGDFPSGVYIARLQSSSESQLVRMILTK